MLHDECYANGSEWTEVAGKKISPDEPEYSSTTRAERLSRTSPRYAYVSAEPPGCRPGPGRNPAASSAVVVPGES